MLSGHGCFGAYLFKICREILAECHNCGSDNDDAAHTRLRCPAWSPECLLVASHLGGVLTLNSVEEILRDPARWSAVATFCSSVLKRKEDSEHHREANGRIQLMDRRH